ncbi:hypothetical protein HOLleu_43417 [Holothuria leucospilota]|uniref:NACHT domain-containing protein n=1 Tax=Holothuria leucospilota TaxID=206669 RepID=A0A9Q0Y9Q1_HOLLE|nr:hypothetical protein HOLleu_43417 [Holothuria leucospilota]
MMFKKCLKTKMKYWYDAMTPMPWKKSCQWRSTDLYIGNLLIFKDSNSTTRHIVTDKKCKLQYNEIFSHDNLSEEKRIIVEGEPGCGKTMLTAQLGYDWSQGLLKGVDILVLLPLKFVGNKTLLQAINEFYIPSIIPLEENDIEEILSSPTERIGVVLDGLEEYFYHESSEVAQVFTENKHPEWKVVLTSRSNCTTGLPKTVPRLQIDLFGEEERNSYIEKLYKQNKEKQEEIDEDFRTTAKTANRRDDLKVKEPDVVPQQTNNTLINETSSKNVGKEPATVISATTRHVPQMVKFLHRVVQEWFAAAFFSTMLKKCTNRDQYYEYISEHLPQISPTDLHYVLRFSCFLHPPFCYTIINHLLHRYRLKDQSVPSYIMDCIFLCFVEHHGSKESDIEEIVAKVCKEEIIIHSRDSRFLQSAKCALLHYASQSMVRKKYEAELDYFVI